MFSSVTSLLTKSRSIINQTFGSETQCIVSAMLYDDHLEVLTSFEMNRVASLTFGDVVCDEIFDLLEHTIQHPLEFSTLSIQKTLALIHHLSIYASNGAANLTWSRLLCDITTLRQYNTVLLTLDNPTSILAKIQTIKGGSVDHGRLVREEAIALVALLEDVAKWRELRDVKRGELDSLVPVGDKEEAAFVSEGVKEAMREQRRREKGCNHISVKAGGNDGGFGSGFAGGGRTNGGNAVVGAAFSMEDMLKHAKSGKKRYTDGGLTDEEKKYYDHLETLERELQEKKEKEQDNINKNDVIDPPPQPIDLLDFHQDDVGSASQAPSSSCIYSSDAPFPVGNEELTMGSLLRTRDQKTTSTNTIAPTTDRGGLFGSNSPHRPMNTDVAAVNQFGGGGGGGSNPFGEERSDPFGGGGVANQFGGGGRSTAAVDPFGGGSTAAVDQFGGRSTAVVDPFGGESTAAVDQYGGGSISAVDPFGGGSTAAVNHFGGGYTAAVDQFGGGSGAGKDLLGLSSPSMSAISSSTANDNTSGGNGGGGVDLLDMMDTMSMGMVSTSSTQPPPHPLIRYSEPIPPISLSTLPPSTSSPIDLDTAAPMGGSAKQMPIMGNFDNSAAAISFIDIHASSTASLRAKEDNVAFSSIIGASNGKHYNDTGRISNISTSISSAPSIGDDCIVPPPSMPPPSMLPPSMSPPMPTVEDALSIPPIMGSFNSSSAAISSIGMLNSSSLPYTNDNEAAFSSIIGTSVAHGKHGDRQDLATGYGSTNPFGGGDTKPLAPLPTLPIEVSPLPVSQPSPPPNAPPDAPPFYAPMPPHSSVSSFNSTTNPNPVQTTGGGSSATVSKEHPIQAPTTTNSNMMIPGMMSNNAMGMDTGNVNPAMQQQNQQQQMMTMMQNNMMMMNSSNGMMNNDDSSLNPNQQQCFQQMMMMNQQMMMQFAQMQNVNNSSNSHSNQQSQQQQNANGGNNGNVEYPSSLNQF